MFKSIDEIKAANRRRDEHWFDPNTLRFFSSRVSDRLHGGRFFVTSEADMRGEDRRYSIRVAHTDGRIGNIRVGGEAFRSVATSSRAHRIATRIAELYSIDRCPCDDHDRIPDAATWQATVGYRWQFCTDDRDLSGDLYAESDATEVRAWSGAHGDVCLMSVRLNRSGLWSIDSTEGFAGVNWHRWSGFATPGDALDKLAKNRSVRLLDLTDHECDSPDCEPPSGYVYPSVGDRIGSTDPNGQPEFVDGDVTRIMEMPPGTRLTDHQGDAWTVPWHGNRLLSHCGRFTVKVPSVLTCYGPLVVESVPTS